VICEQRIEPAKAARLSASERKNRLESMNRIAEVQLSYPIRRHLLTQPRPKTRRLGDAAGRETVRAKPTGLTTPSPRVDRTGLRQST
jgi:hypothetical protein